MENESEYSLTDQIKEDRMLAYLLRKFCAQGKELTHRNFPTLPRRDKACAEVLWELLKAEILTLEFDEEADYVFLRPGPNRSK